MGLRAGPQLLHDLAQADVLAQIVRAHPSAVQPQHVDLAVPGAQLADLPVDKLHILLPQLGVLFHVIVHVAGGSRAELGRPVIGTVPVGL